MPPGSLGRPEGALLWAVQHHALGPRCTAPAAAASSVQAHGVGGWPALRAALCSWVWQGRAADRCPGCLQACTCWTCAPPPSATCQGTRRPWTSAPRCARLCVAEKMLVSGGGHAQRMVTPGTCLGSAQGWSDQRPCVPGGAAVGQGQQGDRASHSGAAGCGAGWQRGTGPRAVLPAQVREILMARPPGEFQTMGRRIWNQPGLIGGRPWLRLLCLGAAVPCTPALLRLPRLAVHAAAANPGPELQLVRVNACHPAIGRAGAAAPAGGLHAAAAEHAAQLPGWLWGAGADAGPCAAAGVARPNKAASVAAQKLATSYQPPQLMDGPTAPSNAYKDGPTA